MATVTIEPPHAEMRISPTHVYQFFKDDGPRGQIRPPATKVDNFKQFVLNQDLLRISLPKFPRTRAKPRKLRIFTELDETGEEMVERRSAEGTLPLAVIFIPRLEGLEPVLQYCYRPDPWVFLAQLLGEQLVDFCKPYKMVDFRKTEKPGEECLSRQLLSLQVARRISLSRPIPVDGFDQLLLSRIHFVDAVACVGRAFHVYCPGFWNALKTAHRILFDAAAYHYQETHDEYKNPCELEAFTPNTV